MYKQCIFCYKDACYAMSDALCNQLTSMKVQEVSKHVQQRSN
jgi:hypothetical protein